MGGRATGAPIAGRYASTSRFLQVEAGMSKQSGSMSKLTAWVTAETAAAAMAVLEREVDTMRRDGDLAPQEQLAPGVNPETWDGRRRANLLHAHLLAIAFGDTITGLLDDNRVGSRHGIAPSTTQSCCACVVTTP